MKDRFDRLLAAMGRVFVWNMLFLIAGVSVTAAAMMAAPQLTPPPIAPVILQLHPLESRGVPAVPADISPAAKAADALKSLVAQHRCLSEAMYYEARGEGDTGERAIAEVVFHRLAEGGHGRSLCAVIYQGAGQTFCQFTFVCDGSLGQAKESEAWRAAQVLAARLLAGEVPDDQTAGATNYHAASVHPGWAPKMEQVAHIGNHIFYRAADGQPFRGSLQ